MFMGALSGSHSLCTNSPAFLIGQKAACFNNKLWNLISASDIHGWVYLPFPWKVPQITPVHLYWGRQEEEDRLWGRTPGCIMQRTGCFLPRKAQDCSLQHVSEPRNGLWRSLWVSHFAESEAEVSLKNTQLWHSSLHCSAGPSFIILSIFRTRMKAHFFTLFYWEPWTVMNIGFCFVLFCFLDTLMWFPTHDFLFKDIL